MGYNFAGEFSGAFSVDQDSDTRAGATDGNNVGRSQKFLFDASLSNEIYGKSDKVLPDNITLIAQIKY